jgi:hypothetical protein
MELVLYTHYEAADPFTFIAKAWATLCAIEEFTEEVSDFNWGSAGYLPVLRCDGQVYSRNHVLDFLKLAYDLSGDLEADERLKSALLEELVYSQLHQASQHAIWVDDNAIPVVEGWASKLKNWPLRTYKRLTTKSSVTTALQFQHNILSPEAALRNADLAHQKLSESLGEGRFFFSKPGRPEYPRNADIVVAAFLLEELTHLKSHPHVTQSLAKYPNLIAFAGLMHKILYERSNRSPSANPALSHLFVNPPLYPEVAVYYPPQVPFYRESLAKSKHFSFVLGYDNAKKCDCQQADSLRRLYVSGIAGVLFSFLLLKTHLA